MKAKPKRYASICPTCGRKLRVPMVGETTFAKAIFAKRTGAHLDLRAAAQEAGVTLSTLHRAERGRMPSVEHAVKIAEWLGQSLDALFRETR